MDTMPVRTSEATWTGRVRDGDGEMALGSGAWKGGYSFRSRFSDEEPSKSNPEELLAAGHAGCFSLALANLLEQEDYAPERIHTKADCHMEMDEEQGPTITRIELDSEATVPDITDDRFQEIAHEAKRTCPVSRALGGVEVTLDATRES